LDHKEEHISWTPPYDKYVYMYFYYILEIFWNESINIFLIYDFTQGVGNIFLEYSKLLPVLLLVCFAATADDDVDGEGFGAHPAASFAPFVDSSVCHVPVHTSQPIANAPGCGSLCG